jgi:hypothetical protein
MSAQPSLLAELKAMGREAVKDIRNTGHEVFFGRGEGAGEPGTPLNPTPQIVTDQLEGKTNESGKSTLDDLRSYAAEKQKEAEQKMEKDGPDQDRSLEM